jgi:hypothetical protein
VFFTNKQDARRKPTDKKNKNLRDKKMIAKDRPEFVTVTCLEWKPILNQDRLRRFLLKACANVIFNG